MKQIYLRYSIVIFFLLTGCFSSLAQGTLVDFSSIPKSGTILIYSHQDDDAIWMLPFWNITEKFIEGAMPSTSEYRNLVSDQQAFMDNNGYSISYEQNWETPWPDITDNQYYWYYGEANPSYNYLLNDHLETRLANDTEPLSTSEINKMKAKLEQYISDPSVSRIMTHNNWGEYGHQHHRAVNRAVRELAVKYRKDVWMLGCDNGNFINVYIPAGITYTEGTWDTVLFAGIRSVYMPYQYWTWSDTYTPTGTNNYIKVVDAGIDKSNLLTEDQVTISGPVQDESGSYIFDGVDDYMTLAGNSTTSFTIAMKVRPSVISSMDISKMTEYPSNATSDRNFFLNSNGSVSASIFDGSSKVVTSTTSLSAGNWTHITMTGNGSSLKIYVNGILENTIPAGSAITSYTTPEFVLGQTGVTTSFFNGQINDVKLYDRALTDSEIAGLAGVVHKITAATSPDGTISPSGAVNVAEGSNPVFTITANTDYRISDVIVDDISVGAVSSYTFNNVLTDHTIRAEYTAVPTKTITATGGTGGTITPAGTVVVSQGSDQTFTITAASGYRISGVLVDNNPVGAVSTFIFSNINSNHTISATFAIRTYTITGSAGSGGTISPTGAVSLNYGSSRTFNILADIGFSVSDVRIDNVSIGAVSIYTFSNVTANHTISVTFAPTIYRITSSAGTGGSINPQGAVSVTYGTSRSFSITPGIGFNISDVFVDNISMGAVSTYNFSNVTANHTISATFTPITFTITSSGGTGGSINPPGTVSVNYGTDHTYSITPAVGYSISDVRVDNISVGLVSSYTFNSITGNHTISATFGLLTYTLAGNAGAEGIITPAGNTVVNYGAGQAYSITPNTGYSILDVLVDNISVGAVSSYTFSNVVSDHTISASFSRITFRLTCTSGAGGTLTPPGITTINYGSSQTYSITADYGYEISDVRVDNASVGAFSSYTFSNITSNHTISAAFTLVKYTITGSSGTGGTISPAGIITLSHGSDQTYTISPETGFEITDVKVDGSSMGKAAAYTFRDITRSHTISAAFSILGYKITASAGDGGRISPQDVITADYGTSSTFTITPDVGYEISNVTVDNVSVGAADTYTFNNITENHTVSATFTIKTFTVTASSGANGSIDPAGVTTLNYGTGLEFSFTPAPGYRISDVMVDNESVGILLGFSFENVVSNHTISVSFEPIKMFSISANAGAGGSIDPKGMVTIPEESTQTYQVTPDKGYRILHVTVDGLDLGSVSEYTFNSVFSDHSITAAFTTETLVSAYPSPFSEEFKVKVETPLPGKFDLYVFDVTSRVAYSKSGVDGNEEIKVNLKSSPRGIYIVRLYYDNVMVSTIKVIKF